MSPACRGSNGGDFDFCYDDFDFFYDDDASYGKYCRQGFEAFIDLFAAFVAEKQAHENWYERRFISGDFHFSAQATGSCLMK